MKNSLALTVMLLHAAVLISIDNVNATLERPVVGTNSTDKAAPVIPQDVHPGNEHRVAGNRNSRRIRFPRQAYWCFPESFDFSYPVDVVDRCGLLHITPRPTTSPTPTRRPYVPRPTTTQRPTPSDQPAESPLPYPYPSHQYPYPPHQYPYPPHQYPYPPHSYPYPPIPNPPYPYPSNEYSNPIPTYPPPSPPTPPPTSPPTPARPTLTPGGRCFYW